FDHVVPPSFENASSRSYASGSGLLAFIQTAASEHSASARTDGASAALITRSLPEAPVFGVVQPAGVRSANLNKLRGTARSIQLTIARSPVVVSCGAELASPAGDGSASTLRVHSRSAGAEEVVPGIVTRASKAA